VELPSQKVAQSAGRRVAHDLPDAAVQVGAWHSASLDGARYSAAEVATNHPRAQMMRSTPETGRSWRRHHRIRRPAVRLLATAASLLSGPRAAASRRRPRGTETYIRSTARGRADRRPGENALLAGIPLVMGARVWTPVPPSFPVRGWTRTGSWCHYMSVPAERTRHVHEQFGVRFASANTATPGDGGLSHAARTASHAPGGGHSAPAARRPPSWWHRSGRTQRAVLPRSTKRPTAAVSRTSATGWRPPPAPSHADRRARDSRSLLLRK
jgi:hypothetical protein